VLTSSSPIAFRFFHRVATLVNMPQLRSLLVIMALGMLAACASKPTSVVKSPCPSMDWPPPRASMMRVVPNDLLGLPALGLRAADINEGLNRALSACGYFQRSYLLVPDGFAIVTQLEQINDDGTPKPPPERWSAELPKVEPLSSAWFRALFTAQRGRYRIIVFVITPTPFSQKNAEASRDEAAAWLKTGCNTLPSTIAAVERDFAITALVYEFVQPEYGDGAQVDSTVDHLELAGLTKAMRERR
jgi:hypothetical protein